MMRRHASAQPEPLRRSAFPAPTVVEPSPTSPERLEALQALVDAASRTPSDEADEPLLDAFGDPLPPAAPRPTLLVAADPMALDSVAVGVLMLDADQRVVLANAEACRLLGERGRIVGHSIGTALLTRLPNGQPSPFISADTMRRAERVGRWSRSGAHLLGRGGSLVPVDYSLLPRHDGAAGWTVTLVDVSDREASQNRLQWKANHDDLTGLSSRSAFTAQLDRLLADAPSTGRWPGVLFIDLDRFKYVNDAHGHGVGDQLLTIAADRITALVGAGDVVARFGGDEFVVLVADCTNEPERIGHLAEALRALLDQRYTISGIEVYVPASIGVAIARHGVHTSGDVLRTADLAMYRAKALGRNQVVLASDDLRREAEERSEIERGLRHAVNNGELQVVYQPIRNIHSGALVGFEALARWSHPTLGDISPDRFIRIAEESGLIAAIGERMTDMAIRDAASWRRESGRPYTVHVNVSSLELMSGAHLKVVNEALQRHQLPGDLLVVEVTEGVLIDDPDLARRQLQALNRLGVQVAIDDFGTGYSSLAYLRRFPLHMLKIDREFVSGIAALGHSQRIVKAITDIAEGNGFKVLAEGVETHSELATVRRLGCTLAQGHLLGMPMPAAEALLMATSHPIRREFATPQP